MSEEKNMPATDYDAIFWLKGDTIGMNADEFGVKMMILGLMKHLDDNGRLTKEFEDDFRRHVSTEWAALEDMEEEGEDE